MRKWLIPLVSVAALAACGETSEQRTTTGAVGGGVAGAVVGGPVGAVVGAGVGAVAGANREKIDEGTDKAADATKEKVAEASDKIDAKMEKTTARSADRVAGPTNVQVKNAQVALQDIGLYDGKIDGIYGRRTIKAVAEFQAKNDLPRTGTLTERTRDKLQQVASAGDMKKSQDTMRDRTGSSTMQSPGTEPAATRQESETTPGNQPAGQSN